MLLRGDCLEKLKELESSSIDSIVTDPPYGLSFMGKKWDYDVPSIEIWKEALRVLKPGGHLLAFGGTRTYHRLVVNIEDAGFEIRDQIQWLYGSGFPKSTNVALRIDKESGAIKTRGGVKMKMGHGDSGITKPSTGSEPFESYESKSVEAKQWQGWGTALKPANEPICVARKPLAKGLTLAQNVLKYGNGAINIDASRIETSDQGRWSANIILDESAAEMLDEQSGILKSGELKGYKSKESENIAMSGKNYAREFTKSTKSEGGASRFFYVAKASKRERGDGNLHPTVKPIKLMEYLIKLVTPPNGTVLDPFMGSGSTGVACKKLGFEFVGIELSEEYFEIAENRVCAWL